MTSNALNLFIAPFLLDIANVNLLKRLNILDLINKAFLLLCVAEACSSFYSLVFSQRLGRNSK